jgi:hypothetical protein
MKFAGIARISLLFRGILEEVGKVEWRKGLPY